MRADWPGADRARSRDDADESAGLRSEYGGNDDDGDRFLDPATRMNPNLNYAQYVPGHNDGRGTGIIDTRDMVDLVDDVGLLAGAAAWTSADQDGVTTWFSDYLHWLQTSPNGKDEANAKNNHGSFYDTQIVSLALLVSDSALANEVLPASEQKRIASQIEPGWTSGTFSPRTAGACVKRWTFSRPTRWARRVGRIETSTASRRMTAIHCSGKPRSSTTTTGTASWPTGSRRTTRRAIGFA